VIIGAELTKPIENEPETGAAIPSETVAENENDCDDETCGGV
jgi:hypothetical protein